MAKKFIDINNLKLVWDEINKRFVRNSKFLELESAVTTPIFFNSNISAEVSLCPPSGNEPVKKWDIEQGYYDDFIEFCNANNLKKYVVSDDGVMYDVICKSFYSKDPSQYNGLILSSNDGPEKVNFWFLRAEKITSAEKTEYILSWGEWVGDLDDTYVKLSDYNKEWNDLHDLITNCEKHINNINSKLDYLEKYLNIDIPDLEEDEEDPFNYYNFTLRLKDEDYNPLTGIDILDINSIEYLDDVKMHEFNIHAFDEDGNVVIEPDKDSTQKTKIDAESIELLEPEEPEEPEDIELGYIDSNKEIVINSHELKSGKYFLKYEDEDKNIIDNFEHIAEITIE